MTNINLPTYDVCRDWIRKARINGTNWESILYACKETEMGLEAFIDTHISSDFWPVDLNNDIWYKIVKSEKQSEQRSKAVEIIEEKTLLIDNTQDNDVSVPPYNQSSWQLYKKHLLETGFKEDSVDEIEKATIALLKRLNKDTRETGSIKGLVIGHVQSGKTSNMAALMAMAADWGWNFFVVLSGTIESLRKQTQSRLLRDLNRPGNIYWQGLEHLSRKCTLESRLQELRLEEDAIHRYFTVCLKNPARLKKLNEWLHTDKNKLRQIKMIIIDDEADQASINTADISANDKTKINKLIVDLVEGHDCNGQKTEVTAKAINYISYTATPYANFLNESTPESLYPRNFIRALTPSNEYFGPKQIFGIEETDECDGLNILREITKSDLSIIKKLHDGELGSIPDTLRESIVWFFCCVANMRVRGYKKPISMLVHTSQKQAHHEEISNAIKNWVLNTDVEEILAFCKSVWEFESKSLTKDSFRKAYQNYGRSNDDIYDYLEFSDLLEQIILLVEDVTHIPLGDEGVLDYKSHIHLCVDNCSKNKITEDGMYVRLAYPDLKLDPYPFPAPAFIVVGGSTLSRGLTIEGLVSTYFLRSTCQADSLMQMGRWFGYRKGYELMPRIWMTSDTIDKFKFLSLLEYELRDDLNKYMIAGASPLDYGPRVKNTPKISWLRITGKRRMQSALEIDIDYTGTSSQTILFENNHNILFENIKCVEDFIQVLGRSEISCMESSHVWRNVDFNLINSQLFNKYKAHDRSRVFNDISTFAEWVKTLTESGALGSWNIILAGNGQISSLENESIWDINGIKVGKVNRSRKIIRNSSDNTINIGVLRSPKDLLADVHIDKLSDSSKNLLFTTVKAGKINEIRKESGIDNNPQLIIYRINKDSKARTGYVNDNILRVDLNAVEDIIGLCVTLPGISKNRMAQTLTIRIDQDKNDEEWVEE